MLLVDKLLSDQDGFSTTTLNIISVSKNKEVINSITISTKMKRSHSISLFLIWRKNQKDWYSSVKTQVKVFRFCQTVWVQFISVWKNLINLKTTSTLNLTFRKLIPICTTILQKWHTKTCPIKSLWSQINWRHSLLFSTPKLIRIHLL